MLTRSFLQKATLASILAATAVVAQTPYDEGQKALREQRWTDATGQFEEAIEADQSRADAATYWLAYAYARAGRSREAEREIRRLEHHYPQSRWLKEARALRIEVQGASSTVEHLAAEGDELDEDLRLFALAQLIDRDPERTLPLVQDLMHNAQSPDVRRDALFLLSINDHPEAREMLLAIAANESDPGLQHNAVEMLGIMGASSELKSVYATAQDPQLKVTLVEAFSMAGDSATLYSLLETEENPELRRALIAGIAMNDGAGAADFIREIYENARTEEEKLAILDALTMMDRAEVLALEFLRMETNPELQKQAIHVLGIADATVELRGLYGNLESPEARVAVLEAMSIAGDTEGLLHILETEQDRNLRTAAIHGLAITDEQEAARHLRRLYGTAPKSEKKVIIESMMITEDSAGLIEMMKSEQDPELKRLMLQMLSVMDSEASDDYLFEMLEKSE